MVYVFKIPVQRGILIAPIEASGYLAADGAVHGVYLAGRILSRDRE